MNVRNKLIVLVMIIIWFLSQIFYYPNPYEYQIHLVDVENMYSSIIVVVLFSVFIVFFAKKDKYRVLLYFLISGMISGLLIMVLTFYAFPNIFYISLHIIFLVPFFGFNYLTETSWDLIFLIPSLPYLHFLLLYILISERKH